MTTARPSITLFVYGTLKRGQRHHDRFCRSAKDMRPAIIVGCVYQSPSGFAALGIPGEAILAEGTSDPLADASTQAHSVGRGLAMPDPAGDWDIVQGDLLAFLAPFATYLPRDRFEGFRLDEHGHCHRALEAVRASTGLEVAWVYQLAPVAHGRRVHGGRWPTKVTGGLP